jgi:hypothetical protein
MLTKRKIFFCVKEPHNKLFSLLRDSLDSQSDAFLGEPKEFSCKKIRKIIITNIITIS